MYHASIAIECVFKLWAPIRPFHLSYFVCACACMALRDESCALFPVCRSNTEQQCQLRPFDQVRSG